LSTEASKEQQHTLYTTKNQIMLQSEVQAKQIVGQTKHIVL
jgi:hypothetical protein